MGTMSELVEQYYGLDVEAWSVNTVQNAIGLEKVALARPLAEEEVRVLMALCKAKVKMDEQIPDRDCDVPFPGCDEVGNLEAYQTLLDKVSLLQHRLRDYRNLERHFWQLVARNHPSEQEGCERCILWHQEKLCVVWQKPSQ